MAEYWKSTPKYWCKHCETFVVDTKLARSQHEATGKHQGALKRFLRDLTRKGEREAREKDAAKREVERLNGIVSGTGSSSKVTGLAPVAKPVGTLAVSKHTPTRQATEAERKAQMSQLAALGVSLPGEVRKDMAMPGEWEVVEVQAEPAQATAGAGEKRKFEDGELLDEEVKRYRRKGTGGKLEELDIDDKEMKGWKAREKAYPGMEEEEDAEALPPPPMRFGFKLKKEEPSDESAGIKTEPDVKTEPTIKPEAEETSGVPQNVPTIGETATFKARKPKNLKKK